MNIIMCRTYQKNAVTVYGTSFQMKYVQHQASVQNNLDLTYRERLDGKNTKFYLPTRTYNWKYENAKKALKYQSLRH